jgi:glycosyltransferase involved in cell wall biosynthesis
MQQKGALIREESRLAMRLLVLTRYYPPEISGGARRPFGLVKGLRDLGVEVTLCGPDGIEHDGSEAKAFIGVPHPSFPAVPDGVGLAAQTNVAQRGMNWLRKHVLLPDPEIRFALRAVRYIKASGQNFDWVLTTSPPESLHVAGWLLKRHLGCKWVGDVRDMWIERPQRQELSGSALRRWIEQKIARATLGRADAVVAVSEAVMAEMRTYIAPKTPTAIIGHFASPFSGVAEKLPAASFNIVHTGAITLSNPLSQFHSLLTDFEGLAHHRPDAMLWMAGNLTVDERQALATSPFARQINILGPVNMERARALQLGADALALVSGSTSHALPGKFSEYVQARKPILISAPGPWTALIPAEVQTYTFAQAARWTSVPQMPHYSGHDHHKASADLLALLKGEIKTSS